MPKTTVPNEIKSAAELARRMGVNRSQVSRWMKRPTWTFGGPPWAASVVDSVREWVEVSVGDGPIGSGLDGLETPSPSDTPDEHQAKLRVLMARASLLEGQLAKLKETWIQREEVEAGRVARIYDVKARMVELLNRAPELANRPAEDCRTILEGWFREVCDAYAAA